VGSQILSIQLQHLHFDCVRGLLLSYSSLAFHILLPNFLANCQKNYLKKTRFYIIGEFEVVLLQHWDPHVSFYSSSCWFTWACDYHFVSQAAEQAKASPALVAKDPSAPNKKEDDDLAKGKETSAHWNTYWGFSALFWAPEKSFAILGRHWKNVFEEVLSLNICTLNTFFYW